MFKDKVAIITGGSGGIGIEAAKKFLKKSASVAIIGKNPEKLAEAEKILAPQGKVLAIQGDVSKEKEIKEAFKQIIEKFGRVDILVNNAGVALVRKLVDTTLEEWNWIMAVNMTGTFLMSREVASWMAKNKTKGKIVNISSITGSSGSAMVTAYSASKAAVQGFTKALAKELAPNINVNCICPGAVDTDMFRKGTIETVSKLFKIDEKTLVESTIKAIPLKRILEPWEVADLILYLASRSADGITGQTYTISCGYEIH